MPWIVLATGVMGDGYIPMSDSVLRACIESRSVFEGWDDDADGTTCFYAVGMLVSTVWFTDRVEDGTLTHGATTGEHCRLYKSLPLWPDVQREPGASPETCPPCIVVVRKCSLVVQPGPRFDGDLPSVLASGSSIVGT